MRCKQLKHGERLERGDIHFYRGFFVIVLKNRKDTVNVDERQGIYFGTEPHTFYSGWDSNKAFRKAKR